MYRETPLGATLAALFFNFSVTSLLFMVYDELFGSLHWLAPATPVGSVAPLQQVPSFSFWASSWSRTEDFRFFSFLSCRQDVRVRRPDDDFSWAFPCVMFDSTATSSLLLLLKIRTFALAIRRAAFALLHRFLNSCYRRTTASPLTPPNLSFFLLPSAR